ncbi:SprT-like domain-containing protein [Isoptericola sp. NEAU-Y5]|uniref:SprT-like domain-containing protein n=1 Tax=Isoptericola luteus TaxID=2879484 RepID=A0ABS7ZB69_9MICO|nr:SprT-like domain-containing protein [Isoptericola sp. NEAU-Y5]MCA5892289.1 SprT-like domain-containing protein [Isoptericola sp. NEAU-Y5]
MDQDAAARLARGLIAEHGLEGWTFRFDRARRRAGLCRHDRREISLSGPLTALYDEADVREVVLHEVAHALVGARHGHDARWRATARRIGASGRRLVSEDSPQIDGPWVGTCPSGHRVTRHRRPQPWQACGRCSRTFDRRYLLAWSYRGAPVPALSGGARSGGPRPAGGSEGSAVSAVAGSGIGVDAASVRPGDRLRVTAPGRYDGVEGELVKRGRTRFHLRVPGAVLTVPFGLVERAR